MKTNKALVSLCDAIMEAAQSIRSALLDQTVRDRLCGT